MAQSVAREWNEVLLQNIRNDFARPTIHARNLFHTSAVMYDAWAAYDETAKPYFLGNSIDGFNIPFEGVPYVENVQEAQEEAISYAAYRLMSVRFLTAPNPPTIFNRLNNKMDELGYDIEFTSTDYVNGPPAALGNYIADQIIQYSLLDGSNQQNDYANLYYEPINPDLDMSEAGNPGILDPNRWQPLGLTEFIDQSGNPVTDTPPFLSPEWGNVVPFSLSNDDMVTYNRNGDDYNVFLDPGAPPYLDPTQQSQLEDNWKWGMVMVAIWSSHLSPDDGEIWDISPANIGNLQNLPTNFDDFDQVYNFFDGGDSGEGWDVNPSTGEPYTPQYVPRGDYGRILAEFWADGPDSETPPGHWYTIMNYVSDHPELEKRWEGEGEILSDLEWDIRTYFTLGGAMHDSAIATWSVKGWYDYVRPVSAIRYMAEKGQSSDPTLPNYDPAGFPLIPGYVELIEPGDELAGINNENVGEVKIYTWRGPDYIENELIDEAGVGWILAGEWWPYQRPSFVTPPFAGYVSGHSTYSRAAAETLTRITGDNYFPGGIGLFDAEQNEFLVFEEGPSINIQLQWATYQDASDQCSLSRIWGGIHPPADDIPGRLIGLQIGNQAFDYAQTFISPDEPRILSVTPTVEVINDDENGNSFELITTYNEDMNMMVQPSLSFVPDSPVPSTLTITGAEWANTTNFIWTFEVADNNETKEGFAVQIQGAENMEGVQQLLFSSSDIFTIDTENPTIEMVTPNDDLINDASIGLGTFTLTVEFSEVMEMNTDPVVSFPEGSAEETLIYNAGLSGWSNETQFIFTYDIVDSFQFLADQDIEINNATDAHGNVVEMNTVIDVVSIDTQNPSIANIEVNQDLLNDNLTGLQALVVSITFAESMNNELTPTLALDQAFNGSLILNEGSSNWLSDTEYTAVYNLVDEDIDASSLDLTISNFEDLAGNPGSQYTQEDFTILDTLGPSVTSSNSNESSVSDNEVGTATLSIDIEFSEAMDENTTPALTWFSDEDISTSLVLNTELSAWNGNQTYTAVFDCVDQNIEVEDIDLNVEEAMDANMNMMDSSTLENILVLDTRNPQVLLVSANDYLLENNDVGAENFTLLAIFDEPMSSALPLISFPDENPLTNGITPNPGASSWVNENTFYAVFDVNNTGETLSDIDIQIGNASDVFGNAQENRTFNDYFSILIDNSVTVAEMLFEQQPLLFPNPVDKGAGLQLQTGRLSGQVQLDIINLNGQIVWNETKIVEASNQLNVGNGELSAGMYILLITHEGNRVPIKFEVR